MTDVITFITGACFGSFLGLIVVFLLVLGIGSYKESLKRKSMEYWYDNANKEEEV